MPGVPSLLRVLPCLLVAGLIAHPVPSCPPHRQGAGGDRAVDLELIGLRVLVTAGGAGIGRGIVEAFATEGARVFTCDVDGTALASLAPEIGRVVADVADRAQVRTMMDSAIAALGGLDVLVNNAGV